MVANVEMNTVFNDKMAVEYTLEYKQLSICRTIVVSLLDSF